MADVSSLHLAEHQPWTDGSRERDPEAPAPRPFTDSVIARDITADFSAAASALGTGQLVKDEYFTLFESVGALEIMDPKMDSGYLQPGESLEDDYDMLRELLPEEVLGIMDQMFCFEMAWHMGSPLSQTLFTSLYLDRMLWPELKRLEDASFDRDGIVGKGNEMLHVVLRAYCLGLIKSCEFVHRKICSEHYYEEEDFVANLYNRDLLSKFDLSAIRDTISIATEYVQDSGNLKKSHKEALLVRLRLRDALLPAVNVEDIIDNKNPGFWDRCSELLPELSVTHHLGQSVLESFSTKVQRRLASSVPPRPIVNISFNEAFAHLTSLCQNAKDAYKILDYSSGSDLMTFVNTYQSRTPQPSVYVRNLMQSLILTEMRILGTLSFKQLLFDDLDELVLPADMLLDPANAEVEAPQDPRFQIARKIDAFITKAADPFLDIFRTLCMNRSRLRRMLCHLVLEWDNIQYEAENVDTELRKYTKEVPIRDDGQEMWSFPLSSWAYYHKLRQIEWIAQTGFELDIYQIDELSGMYWYLQHLVNTRIRHMERIRTFTLSRLRRIAKPNAEQRTAFSRSFSFLEFAILEASATRSFADGLSCLFSFLSHLGLIPAPYHALRYSTPAQRYALRMRPFMSMSLPETPSYEEFASLVSLRSPEATSADGSNGTVPQVEIHLQAQSILGLAEQTLKVARKEWEAVSKTPAETARCMGCEQWWRTSVKNVLRSCITANIMVATAKKTFANAGAKPAGNLLKVEIEESGKGYHAWWVVPKISATPP